MGYRLILRDPSKGKQYVFIFNSESFAFYAAIHRGVLRSSEGSINTDNFEFIRLEKVALGL
ncbi:hypothetical protein P5763_07435 [Bacillus cereus]|uniref:hypothetical protein n=1 Tax=Bacillus cereus TaxID=1396 RepID=UPI0024064581|nr:hypothetical protein [Bacillus cereus]MDF9611904.1 hypothetical protein [Bacillus cereus]